MCWMLMIIWQSKFVRFCCIRNPLQQKFKVTSDQFIKFSFQVWHQEQNHWTLTKGILNTSHVHTFSLEGSASCSTYNQDYENTVYTTISIIFLFISSCSSNRYMFRSNFVSKIIKLYNGYIVLYFYLSCCVLFFFLLLFNF
jgi:hypothetical protein